MAPWLSPTIVGPLVVAAIAFAIYRAFVDPAPQPAVVTASGNTSLPVELPRRWRA